MKATTKIVRIENEIEENGSTSRWGVLYLDGVAFMRCLAYPDSQFESGYARTAERLLTSYEKYGAKKS